MAAEEARVSGDLEKKKRYREQLERMAMETMNANLAAGSMEIRGSAIQA